MYSEGDKHWTLSFYQLIRMGYRDAQWYIKDTWIGFSARKIAKQAVACHTFMASRMMGCLKW